MFAIYLTKVCDPEVGVLDTDIFVDTAEDFDSALTTGLAAVQSTSPFFRTIGTDPRIVIDYGSWSQFIRIVNLEV